MLPVSAEGRCETCRKNSLAQVDMDPVNHCDPQLIDLFGAKDHGPEADVLKGPGFTSTAKNLDASGILS